MFQPAQPGDRDSVGRIAGELIAAEPLQRDDLARTDQPGRREGRLARRNIAQNFLGRAADPAQHRTRPAIGAGDRLRMEAAVGRVAVFGMTGRAQPERRHRRADAVERDAERDREPRPAMGAVGEGVAMAPPAGIERFRRAGQANGCVRRDPGARRAAPAGGDMEARRQPAGEIADLDAVDLRQRRRLAPEAIDQRRDLRLGPAGADQHALAVVQHLAVESELSGDAPHRRAKSDTLHAAAHPDLGRDRRPSDRNLGDPVRPAQLGDHARTVAGSVGLTYC